MPEVCTATVHAIPPTGIPGWVVPAIVAGAIVLLATGTALLLLASRGGRHAIALVTLMMLAGASTASATPAHASTGAVSYSEGCRLIVVSDVVVPAAAVGHLVPGDELRIVTGSVSNPTIGAIRITVEGIGGPDADSWVRFSTGIDGTAADTAVIPAGGRVVVSLTASIPESTGNAAQGLTSNASLRVTAVQS